LFQIATGEPISINNETNETSEPLATLADLPYDWTTIRAADAAVKLDSDAAEAADAVGGASALVTFIRVLCTLRTTKIVRSICNFTHYTNRIIIIISHDQYAPPFLQGATPSDVTRLLMPLSLSNAAVAASVPSPTEYVSFFRVVVDADAGGASKATATPSSCR
jgi:hypothetical protein